VCTTITGRQLAVAVRKLQVAKGWEPLLAAQLHLACCLAPLQNRGCPGQRHSCKRVEVVRLREVGQQGVGGGVVLASWHVMLLKHWEEEVF
jgi:hypothetical protein